MVWRHGNALVDIEAISIKTCTVQMAAIDSVPTTWKVMSWSSHKTWKLKKPQGLAQKKDRQLPAKHNRGDPSARNAGSGGDPQQDGGSIQQDGDTTQRGDDQPHPASSPRWRMAIGRALPNTHHTKPTTTNNKKGVSQNCRCEPRSRRPPTSGSLTRPAVIRSVP